MLVAEITATPLFFTTSTLELELNPSVSVGCVELLVLILLVLMLLRLRLPLEPEDTERTSELNHESVWITLMVSVWVPCTGSGATSSRRKRFGEDS